MSIFPILSLITSELMGNEWTANGECSDHVVQGWAAVTKLLLSQYYEALNIRDWNIRRSETFCHMFRLRQSFMFVKMGKVETGSENNDNELVLISV